MQAESAGPSIDMRYCVVSLVMLATAAPAHAEVHLDAGVGLGVVAYDPCGYPDATCVEPAHRVLGVAPRAGIGARAVVVDAHAVMHGESAALFFGVGLSWTPPP